MIDYDTKIKKIITDLEVLRVSGVNIAGKVICESFFKEDMYFMSIIDKSLRLIDGFIDMINQRNLTCMGILLRIQLDNCMRTFAFYIAEDKNKVIESLMNSNISLGQLKVKSGNKIKDYYLHEKLTDYDSQFSNVYKQASGYIHHSKKAFYNIVNPKENNTLEFNIGHPLSSRYDPVILECSYAFIHFIKLQFKLINPFIQSKEQYDSK